MGAVKICPPGDADLALDFVNAAGDFEDEDEDEDEEEVEEDGWTSGATFPRA
ncbi:MAG TPA: hypothetical protein PKE12_03665 [Kiritimatiellia bacterium]|nr:hypothetical protein [Kiritimatiellia bacterium]